MEISIPPKTRRGKQILGIVVALALGGAASMYAFLVTHSFSAREHPTRIEAFLARKARYLATPPGVRGMKNPLSPTPLLVAEARDHFADHCATCHGNDGSGKTMIGNGLYPPAPDMRAKETQELTDGELFYIIKNGIRFTGMPGWGCEDEDNWKLVLFIRRLPDLSPEEHDLMKEVNDQAE